MRCLPVLCLALLPAPVAAEGCRIALALAMDVSRSMLAEDVQPNRITAAQAAARAFIAEQPPQTRIAIVAFAGTANVVQPPTSSKLQSAT